ncbi:hypothetical protein Sjap_005343 [Stephania japonica]|uniref:Beclin 1 n=1 Tax=Stephania japonica TaxID=461633 RepID=A0AAP0K6B1_9MAGN
MEESFVMVPPPAASLYKCESGTDGVVSQSTSTGAGPNNPSQPNNSEFHSTITVEQPLCLECMRVLSDKLDKEVEDVNRDIKAYEAYLQRLEGETLEVLSEADFLHEKLKVFI